MYYSLNGVLGVALSTTRVAICGHVYPVPANPSDPLSTLTRSDVDGVPIQPSVLPEWTRRTEFGATQDRKAFHFQPKTQTLVGDVRLLDLHPGYPIPEADVVMIAPRADKPTRMTWFKLTTLKWEDGLFYDGFGNDADGQPACNGSTFTPAETNDSGSIVMSNGRVVGFVSVVRDGGERLGIARLREEHRTMGLPEPAPVPVPPNPLPQPPASTPSPEVNPVVNTNPNMSTKDLLLSLGFNPLQDGTQAAWVVLEPSTGDTLGAVVIPYATAPEAVLPKIVADVSEMVFAPLILEAQKTQSESNQSLIAAILKRLTSKS